MVDPLLYSFVSRRLGDVQQEHRRHHRCLRKHRESPKNGQDAECLLSETMGLWSYLVRSFLSLAVLVRCLHVVRQSA